MKKIQDITSLKVWKTLKKLGFIKIKFTFQGLAYGYGAELISGSALNKQTITIEPNFSTKLKWTITTRGNSKAYLKRVETTNILLTVNEYLKIKK